MVTESKDGGVAWSQSDRVEESKSHLYYTAEDLGYADATTADARRVKTRQIAAGIAALTSHLRQ
jgi:hypothetical protein